MEIVLIHGLARSPASLQGLAWRLQQRGHRPRQFGYFALTESFDQIVARLRTCLRSRAEAGPYSIVAHSLGGLLTRAALAETTLALPQHVVMLGTPNQPPRLARYAWQLPPFRWFTGECGANLVQPSFFARLPPLRSPYTLLAGTNGPRGPWSPFGDEVNDGIVALSELRLSNRDRIVQFPVEHTFMMYDATVQATVLDILEGADNG